MNDKTEGNALYVTKRRADETFGHLSQWSQAGPDLVSVSPPPRVLEWWTPGERKPYRLLTGGGREGHMVSHHSMAPYRASQQDSPVPQATRRVEVTTAISTIIQ